MKVAFLGDSITEGQIGVSYFDKIQDVLNQAELVNLGKNGDTVHSLYKRIKNKDFSEYNDVVLFIGINDVFGKVSRAHRLVRALQGQSPSKDLDTFILEYKELVDHLLEMNKNIIIISPLLLGEEVDSEWNEKVRQTEVEIELIARNYHLTYLDVQAEMYEYLDDKKQSNYLPISLRQVGKDFVTLKTDDMVDATSKERGLHLTLDGVHLNSKGAQIVADSVIDLLQQKKKS